MIEEWIDITPYGHPGKLFIRHGMVRVEFWTSLGETELWSDWEWEE